MTSLDHMIVPFHWPPSVSYHFYGLISHLDRELHGLDL